MKYDTDILIHRAKFATCTSKVRFNRNGSESQSLMDLETCFRGFLIDLMSIDHRSAMGRLSKHYFD